MTLTSVAIIGSICLVFGLAAIIDEIHKAARSVRTQISIASGELYQEIKEVRAALPHLDAELPKIIRLMENQEIRTELTEIRSVLDNILFEVRDIRDPPKPDAYELMAADWNSGTHEEQSRG